MRKWDFRRAHHWDVTDEEVAWYEPKVKRNVEAARQDFNELLDDGWEPINAQRDSYYDKRSVVWLRKPL